MSESDKMIAQAYRDIETPVKEPIPTPPTQCQNAESPFSKYMEGESDYKTAQERLMKYRMAAQAQQEQLSGGYQTALQEQQKQYIQLGHIPLLSGVRR